VTANTARVLTTMMFWIVLLGGLAIAALNTAWRLFWGCPDFTDSQSGPLGDQSWTLLPPGPVCTTTVHLPDGTIGQHIDSPAFARVLAIIAWIGWLATTRLLRRTLRLADNQGDAAHRLETHR
jgi:hypothetical protein